MPWRRAIDVRITRIRRKVEPDLQPPAHPHDTRRLIRLLAGRPISRTRRSPDLLSWRAERSAQKSKKRGAASTAPSYVSHPHGGLRGREWLTRSG
jgi:hypothetical protein